MAAYYVISSQVPSSNFTGAAPTSDQIIAAFNSVGLYSGAHWVDPSVRIIRLSGGTFSSGDDTTYVARLLSIDDPTMITGASTPGATADQAANFVAGRVTAALGGQNNLWDPVVATPYSAAVNGDTSWWQSGQSDITQTRDQFSSSLSSYVPENPVGPTSSATHPPPGGPGNFLPTLPQLDISLGLLIIGGIVVMALIYAPEIKGLAGFMPPPPKRVPARASIPKTRSVRARTTRRGP